MLAVAELVDAGQGCRLRGNMGDKAKLFILEGQGKVSEKTLHAKLICTCGKAYDLYLTATEAECIHSHKEYVGSDYYFGCGSL